MRKSRVRQLKRLLMQQWPSLQAQHGKRLKPFKVILRLVKEGYNEKFAKGGFELAKVKMTI